MNRASNLAAAMSDFAERIRHARSATKPADVAAPHPELEPRGPRLVEAEEPDFMPPTLAPETVPTVAELEAQQRRIANLTRKIDELNAAILTEILEHPDGLSGYPRTVAALARTSPLATRAPHTN